MQETNVDSPVEQSSEAPVAEKLQTENDASTPANPQAAQYAAELDAMTRAHEASGKPLPPQFKTVEDMYNSYRELQGAYTKSRQELSQLQGTPEAPQEAAPVEPVEAAEAAPSLDGELRLGKEEEPAEEIVEAVQDKPRVTQEVMAEWRTELAATGRLSEETIAAVKERTGFDDSVVEEFVNAQRVIMREAYNKAANVVQGGPDKLQKVISWAKETLSVEDARTVDAGLQGPSWEVVLLGLEAKYDREQAKKPVSNEPKSNSGADIPLPTPGLKGFATREEFNRAMSDPRAQTDLAYQQEISLRAQQTNFNAIPAR